MSKAILPRDASSSRQLSSRIVRVGEVCGPAIPTAMYCITFNVSVKQYTGEPALTRTPVVYLGSTSTACHPRARSRARQFRGAVRHQTPWSRSRGVELDGRSLQIATRMEARTLTRYSQAAPVRTSSRSAGYRCQWLLAHYCPAGAECGFGARERPTQMGLSPVPVRAHPISNMM